MGEPTDLLKLEDLYVKPEYRSLGAGKGFFKRLGEVAQAKVKNISAFPTTYIDPLSGLRPNGLGRPQGGYPDPFCPNPLL